MKSPCDAYSTKAEEKTLRRDDEALRMSFCKKIIREKQLIRLNNDSLVLTPGSFPSIRPQVLSLFNLIQAPNQRDEKCPTRSPGPAGAGDYSLRLALLSPL